MANGCRHVPNCQVFSETGVIMGDHSVWLVGQMLRIGSLGRGIIS